MFVLLACFPDETFCNTFFLHLKWSKLAISDKDIIFYKFFKTLWPFQAKLLAELIFFVFACTGTMKPSISKWLSLI